MESEALTDMRITDLVTFTRRRYGRTTWPGVQWPCMTCGKLISQHRAYCWTQWGYKDGTQVIGIQRKSNGAYCIACARDEAKRQETASQA